LHRAAEVLRSGRAKARREESSEYKPIFFAVFFPLQVGNG